MTTLDCGHFGNGSPRRVCVHLLSNKDQDYFQRFTGTGRDFDLVCAACRKHPEEAAANLRRICADCFYRCEQDGCWDGIVGKPEVLVRPSRLAFRHETVSLSEPLTGNIVDIQPLLSESACIWMVLTADARLLRLDLDRGSVRLVATLPESKIDLSASLALHFSEWDQLGGSRAIGPR